MSVIRPDGIKLDLITISLPYLDGKTVHSERIFSTDNSIKKKLFLQSEKFKFVFERQSAEDIVFSKIDTNKPLKGNYIFTIDMYGMNSDTKIHETQLIIEGKAFGIMGTDELRCDLAIGLLWGTPLHYSLD